MENRVRASIHHYMVSTWLSGDERGFNDDTDLLQAGILDSFTTLSITGYVEETFHVQLDPTDINPENMRSVNALARIVLAKLPKSTTQDNRPSTT
jgi:acyl carrier protein